MVLTPSKINEVIYSHNKCWDKSVLVGKTLKLAKRQKAKKKKNRTKICYLTKTNKSQV